jgi:hypothetical protein
VLLEKQEEELSLFLKSEYVKDTKDRIKRMELIKDYFQRTTDQDLDEPSNE